MSDIFLKRINSVWSRIEAYPAIIQEISSKFCFEVPGANFMQSVRNKYWDGKIRMVKTGNKIYSGLLHELKQFSLENNYSFDTDLDFKEDIKPLSFNKWYSQGEEIIPRDYQKVCIFSFIKNKRRIFLSPTASGKSLIIYTIARELLSRTKGKILIVVPTISLVEQMYSDFEDYSGDTWNSKKNTTRIYFGMPVEEEKRIVISTWQSLYDRPKKEFDCYDAVIGDECHIMKAKEISKLLEKLTNAEYRYGFTGTLDGEHINKLILEGLFGKIKVVATTTELIEQKHLSNFEIKCVILNYSEEEKKKNKNNDYQEEISFINSHEKRNEYLADLAISTKGNCLVLFNRVESHGVPLFKLIESKTKRKVHLIYGITDPQIREEIRKSVEEASDDIIVASSQIFSTGINIKSLANIIFAFPSKSRIRVLQSIGRALRISNKKDGATIFDVCDNLIFKKKKNYTYNHFVERLKLYTTEQFKYSITEKNLWQY